MKKLPTMSSLVESRNKIRLSNCWVTFLLYVVSGLDVYGQRTYPDIPELISQADLTYDLPVSRSEEGLPVGNGRMGSLVWTTPYALHFQINRVDIFANNASTNNFYERHTDYCGGAGLIDFDFSTGSEVFVPPHFKQHLSCYNGQVASDGDGIRTKVVAWMDDDVMAVEVEDNRLTPAPIFIRLRTLRDPLSKKGNHTAKSSVGLNDDGIHLTQEFTEDNYFCASSVMIAVSEVKGRAIQTNDREVRIIIPAGAKRFVVYIASGATFNRQDSLSETTSQKLRNAIANGIGKITESNEEWWKHFWSKSYVDLHSTDGVADMLEKNYTYYLYVMASSSRGNYPAKFNGMLWTTGGDTRKWGSLFWGANQSCLYNALFASNHIELLDPMFRMYSSMYESCADAAVRQWGSEGVYIPETVAFDGLGDLPDSIADEMRELYLLKKSWNERSKQFDDYASTKLPFLSRWNWKKDEGWRSGKWYTSDKGGGPFGHVTHIFSRGAKIAYQYWLKYEYNGDVQWLRQHAYPMLKGVAEFYRNFPNLRREADGRYHIYHINDNESIWGGHNTIEEISSMMGVLPVAIKASEILGVDADLRTSWHDLLMNLSPLPAVERDHQMIWKRSLQPVVQGDADRQPDPNTLPVWFFDLCNMESPDIMKEVANATFDSYFPNGISEKERVYVLSKLPIAGSLLGRKESTRYLIPGQVNSTEIEIMSNRMDLREGEQATSIQRLGRAAEALQLALCQSIPASPGESTVINVFPAWPEEWDASFTLLCRGGFLVTSVFEDGTVQFVELSSTIGGQIRIRNPWPGKTLQVYRNDRRWKKQKGELIIVSSNEGERITIAPAEKKIGF